VRVACTDQRSSQDTKQYVLKGTGKTEDTSTCVDERMNKRWQACIKVGSPRLEAAQLCITEATRHANWNGCHWRTSGDGAHKAGPSPCAVSVRGRDAAGIIAHTRQGGGTRRLTGLQALSQ
jgi:hypothetical protein